MVRHHAGGQTQRARACLFTVCLLLHTNTNQWAIISSARSNSPVTVGHFCRLALHSCVAWRCVALRNWLGLCDGGVSDLSPLTLSNWASLNVIAMLAMQFNHIEPLCWLELKNKELLPYRCNLHANKQPQIWNASWNLTKSLIIELSNQLTSKTVPLSAANRQHQLLLNIYCIITST